MLRRSTVLTLILTLPVVAWGMGMGGSDAPSRIPVPSKPFSATIEDLSGSSVEVTDMTFDGEVHVGGKIGEGLAAVPFAKIAELRVEPSSDADTRMAFIKLLDGSSITVAIDHDTPCFGATSFGYYKIEARSIRRVVFHHPAATP